jgi:hypothetical protein
MWGCVYSSRRGCFSRMGRTGIFTRCSLIRSRWMAGRLLDWHREKAVPQIVQHATGLKGSQPVATRFHRKLPVDAQSKTATPRRWPLRFVAGHRVLHDALARRGPVGPGVGAIALPVLVFGLLRAFAPLNFFGTLNPTGGGDSARYTLEPEWTKLPRFGRGVRRPNWPQTIR